MASRANVYIDQGTDFRIVIDLSDDDGAPLTAMDNYTFQASIRKIYSSTKVVDFTIEKDTPNSRISLILSDDASRTLKPGKYQYDVLMDKQTGERSRIVEGLAFITATITDPTDTTPALEGADAGGISDGDDLDGGQY